MTDYRNVEVGGGLGYTRNGNPLFYKLLEEMAETHHIKSSDYASNENPSGNYHFAGAVASLFSHSAEDAGFVGRLAEKIYRIANLEGSHKEVRNEPIEDTERDIAVITLLWLTDRRQRRAQFKSAAQIRADADMERICSLQQSNTPSRPESAMSWDDPRMHATAARDFNRDLDKARQLEKERAQYPAPAVDQTPDQEVYQLLLNISHSINQFLSKKR